MGKRRNRNRRRKKQQVWTQFRSQSIRQTFEEETDRERYKEEQKRDLNNIAKLKIDLLSRTVVVGSVLPLHDGKNKVALQNFMELHYGPVQKVGVDKKSRGKYPRGRVTFNFKRDAEKLFNGTSLMEAAGRQVKIPCTSVGHKGRGDLEKMITVRPSPEYKGMVEDDLNTNTTIRVNAKDFSLGHWFPQGKDACMNLPGLEDIGVEKTNTWVEENPTQSSPIMIIDTEKGVIELDVTHVGGVEVYDTFATLLGIEQKRKTISFRFKDLAHPVELCRCRDKFFGRENFFIIFALKHSPRLTSIDINLQTDWEDRTRLTEISNGDSCIPGLGSCLGYRLGVSEVEINRMLNAKAFKKLKKMGIFQCEDELDLLHQTEHAIVEKVKVHLRLKLDMKIASTRTHRFMLHLRSILDAQSCAWFDMLNDKAAGQDIFALARDGDYDLVERVLTELRDMTGKTRYPAQMFRAFYDADVEVDELPRQIPEYCVSLPRILITPLRVNVTGFELEMSNRIVRKFTEQVGFSKEAFVRVSIGDENGDRLFSDDLSEQVEARIKSLVLNGITLGKKKYIFLAYSSSQLKEQSLWMVCPERRWSVSEMRKSMGDFSMCLTPSKYAARIGQCFSTTIDTTFSGMKCNGYDGLMNWTKDKLGFSGRSEPENGVSKSPRVKDNFRDITSYNTATGTIMVHSDGVGIISIHLLKDLLLQIPFGPRDKTDVSAIQIRYGGAKGVLVAWDVSQLNIPQYDVYLRPSMVKFKAPYDNLEVITIAKRIPYFLNRNVIFLGQHHKTSDETFLELQEIHIGSLNKMLTDASFAATFLPQLSGPDNGPMTTLRHMLHAGLKPDIDPFLYSCLHCTRAHHLMNLRKKARIHVANGAVLIGGIDELGIIPENCVFLQIQRPDCRKTACSQDDGKYMVVIGQVMVTKHPVVHPGDMRMLQAVDVPELRGHKNIILFSQKGERPEADKMSGSDLDGDQFAVTWDRRLFLDRPSDPMDYSPPSKIAEDERITDASLLQHFINHARNDNLGRIAMLWMDHASIERDAGCSACLNLAKLASIAVDFPKSGIPATIPKELILKRTVPRAHWRERKGLPVFHCDSAVGKLYDRVVGEMKSHHNVQPTCVAMAGRYRDKNGQILYLGDAHQISISKDKIYNPILARRLGWVGDRHDAMLLNFADYQRWLYENQLLELMNQYKIKSEGEVTTGCILKYHKLHKRRRHDVSEEVRRQFRSIRKTFRSEFFTAIYHLIHDDIAFFDGEDNAGQDVADEQLEWIEAVSTGAPTSAGKGENSEAKQHSCRLAAAYYITNYNYECHETGSKYAFYSFPWVVAADVIAHGIS